MAFPFAVPQMVRADYGRVAAGVDFNRDGRADILMASSSELVWMRQTSVTSFTQAAVRTWAGWTLDEVRTADMDGDGDTDVVVNMAAPSRLLILRNDGNFTFTIVLDSPVGTTALPAGAIVGDYDNDGDMDAGMFHTVAGETPRRITWAENDGGVFTLNPVTLNVASLDWIEAVAADFDQNGRKDIAKGLTFVDSMVGAPSGVFLIWPTVTFSGSITHMEAGDIDGDSRPDLVLTSGGAGARRSGRRGAASTVRASMRCRPFKITPQAVSAAPISWIWMKMGTWMQCSVIRHTMWMLQIKSHTRFSGRKTAAAVSLSQKCC